MPYRAKIKRITGSEKMNYKNVYIDDTGIITEEVYKDRLLTLCTGNDARSGIEALIQLEKRQLLKQEDYAMIRYYSKIESVRAYIDDRYSSVPVARYEVE